MTSTLGSLLLLVSTAQVLVGGFGLAGVPEALVKCVQQKGVRDLLVVSNEVGTPDYGVGLWHGQMKRVVLSYVGANRVIEKEFLDGNIELELTPQGTLAGFMTQAVSDLILLIQLYVGAERIRAGGAGIPAFYTPAGFGTWHHTGGIPIKIQKPRCGSKLFFYILRFFLRLLLVGDENSDVGIVSQPKEARQFAGKGYVLEEAITGDFALIKVTIFAN